MCGVAMGVRSTVRDTTIVSRSVFVWCEGSWRERGEGSKVRSLPPLP